MTIESMNELFLHGLQDIYYAENQIVKTLTEMMNQRMDAAGIGVVLNEDKLRRYARS